MSTLAILVLLLGGPASAPASVAPAVAAPMSSAPKPAEGPPPETTLVCLPEVVRVGEPLVCTLTAVHPDSVSITVPLPTGAGEIFVPSSGGPDTPPAMTEKRPDGRLQTVRRFQLVPQEPKTTLAIPPVTVMWHEATGGEGKLEVPGRKVPIKRLLEGAQDPQFRTFKAPASDAAAFLTSHGPVPFVTTNWWALIAAIVLGGGLVGTLLTVLIMRWLAARKRVAPIWFDPRPAHVIALEALARLEGERLPEQGRMKEYYFRLSEVVRAYMEKRFSFAAPEMTSDEIRAHFTQMERDRVSAELATRGLTPVELAILLPERVNASPSLVAVEDFLAETDLVKFADFAPSESAAETVMRAARGIVELTRAPDLVPGTEGSTAAPGSTATPARMDTPA